jgi:hypothetical protein
MQEARIALNMQGAALLLKAKIACDKDDDFVPCMARVLEKVVHEMPLCKKG